MNYEELQVFFCNPEILKKLYDNARIVDPVQKRVMRCFGAAGDLEPDPELISCHGIWQRGDICSNCISNRAARENASIVKMEFVGERLYIVTAVPFHWKGCTLVLELLKDITDKCVFQNFLGAEVRTIQDAREVIYQINETLMKDELTGTFNRRYIHERLPAELARVRLDKTPLTLVMVDVNDFKRINDKYGHVTGDQAIREFALILRNCVRRREDWIARYGGDEFVICLRGVNARLACQMVEQMRQAVLAAVLDIGGEHIALSASFGMATVYNHDITAEELIAAADKNMYESKQDLKCKSVLADLQSETI